LLSAFISGAENVGNATIQYNQTTTVINIQNQTLQTLLPTLFLSLIVVVIILGMTFLGSGIKGISIHVATVVSIFGVIWLCLTVFSHKIFEIPHGIGSIIYVVLTFMYWIGVSGFIAPLSGED